MKQAIIFSFFLILSNKLAGQKNYYLHYYSDRIHLSESPKYPLKFELKDTLPDGNYYVYSNKNNKGKYSNLYIYAEYRNNVKNGVFIEYIKQYMIRSEYKNGNLHGAYFHYSIQKQDTIFLEKGKYESNKKIGRWIKYDESTSRITSIENFNSEGNLDGYVVRVNREGTKIDVSYYRDGIQEW